MSGPAVAASSRARVIMREPPFFLVSFRRELGPGPGPGLGNRLLRGHCARAQCTCRQYRRRHSGAGGVAHRGVFVFVGSVAYSFSYLVAGVHREGGGMPPRTNETKPSLRSPSSRLEGGHSPSPLHCKTMRNVGSALRCPVLPGSRACLLRLRLRFLPTFPPACRADVPPLCRLRRRLHIIFSLSSWCASLACRTDCCSLSCPVLSCIL